MPTRTVRYLVPHSGDASPPATANGTFTARDAAILAGVNERTIRRAISRGDLIATRQSGQFRITFAALQEFAGRRLDRETTARRGALATARPGNSLPIPPTSLVGRTQEIARAAAILSDPDGRLLTLTGPGGVGKTRLALEVASTLAPSIPDGAVFIALDTVHDPELAVKTIANALGVTAAEGRSLLETLCEAMHQREQLLILDNFEHLLPAASVVSKLLASGPALRLLVTSREAIRIRGETELVVSPLEVPDPAQTLSTVSILRSPAVDLFVRRARAVQPGFTLDDDDAQVVAAICQRLEGLPLAIELAAARSKHLPPPLLLDRLKRRLEVLTGGARDLPRRLQTMRSAIAWSYDLLSPPDQRVIRRLAVFSGGFTADAAAYVVDEQRAGDPANESITVTVDRLASLVDKSLLRSHQSEAGTRFTMLETIREFAAEQLLASGEVQSVRARHAAYYLSLAEAATPMFHHLEEAAALTTLESDLGNYRAALAWAIDGEGRSDLGLRLANAIFWLWYVRGYHPEGWQWFQALLSGDNARDAPEARADALIHAGWLALRMGMSEQARSYFTEALSRCQELRMARSTAFARGSCGFAALVGFGDTATATTFLEQARLEAQRVGDGWIEAMDLYGLSIVALSRGDLAGAQALAEQSLNVSRHHGDLQGVAADLAILGQLSRLRGEPEEALRLFAEALDHFQRIGDRGNICTCVEALGGLLTALGRPVQGAHLLGAAAALRESIGTPVQGHEQARYDADVAATRAALSDEAFAAAWSEGGATSLREAISGVAWRSSTHESPPDDPTRQSAPAPLKVLTRRERQVLELIGAGHTDRQIGHLLSISPATVTKHVGNVLGKLGVPSRTAAAIALLTTIPA